MTTDTTDTTTSTAASEFRGDLVETGTMPSLEVTQQSMQGASLMLNPQAMRELNAVAMAMAGAAITVPKHLQGSVGDCLAICMQAAQWGMNPFLVAQKTHVVNGALGYEAQLVNAVLESSGAIKGRFHYAYQGEGEGLQCRVGAVPAGENEILWGEWLALKSVTTKNSPLWKTNPKQQLGYLQVKNWARAFKPGAILGVYTPDELAATAPRDMGAAQVVTPPLPAALLTEAEQAAEKGIAAYQAFWAATGRDNRALLVSEHERLKDAAAAADAQRTVDQATAAPAPAATPASAPAANGTGPTDVEDKRKAPVHTFAQVLDGMKKAKTEDDLNVAADLISSVADAGQRKELEAEYERLRGSFL